MRGGGGGLTWNALEKSTGKTTGLGEKGDTESHPMCRMSVSAAWQRAMSDRACMHVLAL